MTIPLPECLYDGYTITTDKKAMYPAAVLDWLTNESYWCQGIPYAVFLRSFENAYCIGVIKNSTQIGFARLITDYATFGYLADVYVVAGHRGKGIARKMMQLLLDQDWVKSLRGIKLQTSDMHALYRQVGFTDCKYPERIMEISRPDVYRRQTNV